MTLSPFLLHVSYAWLWPCLDSQDIRSEDRAFAGFVRSIQGAVVEKFPGVPTRAIGQDNAPAIDQSLVLEEHAVLTWEKVANAVEHVMGEEVRGATTVSFVPHRYWIS